MDSSALKFPVECCFKIIASKRPGLQAEIEKELRALGVCDPVESGNTSQKGSYQTFNVTTEVKSGEEMRTIDRRLRGIAGVKMVM